MPNERTDVESLFARGFWEAKGGGGGGVHLSCETMTRIASKLAKSAKATAKGKGGGVGERRRAAKGQAG